MENVLLEIKDLKQHFPIKKGFFEKEQKFVKANDGVSLKIHKGETVGLVGESGCGKSTLGRTILKLYEPTSGEIIFDGKNITSLSKHEMNDLRKEMQIIFQDPYSSLNPRMTVGQIIGEALETHNLASNKETLNQRIIEILEMCGLADYHINRYPHQFSGGQRQRIGIARALAVNPSFVVCDEAVSALDVSIQSQIINLLVELQDRLGLSYLFISHDLSVVKHISDKVGVMYLGNLVEFADKNSLYDEPMHPYTQALLSAVPSTNLGEKKERIILKGDIPSNVNTPSGCKFHTRCQYATDKCKSTEPEWREVKEGHFVACHEVR